MSKHASPFDHIDSRFDRAHSRFDGFHISTSRQIESLGPKLVASLDQTFKEIRMWQATCAFSFIAGSAFTLLLVWAAK